MFIYKSSLPEGSKFTGKWMELEKKKKIILSEVTQTQKDNDGMCSLNWMLAVKSLISRLQAV